MIKCLPRFQNVEVFCDEDDCGHSAEFYGTFNECIALAKLEGWSFLPDGDMSKQVCPDCVEFNRNNIERYEKESN